jgi:hypothetical protein
MRLVASFAVSLTKTARQLGYQHTGFYARSGTSPEPLTQKHLIPLESQSISTS